MKSAGGGGGGGGGGGEEEDVEPGCCCCCLVRTLAEVLFLLLWLRLLVLPSELVSKNLHGLQYMGLGQKLGAVTVESEVASMVTLAEARPLSDSHILQVWTGMEAPRNSLLVLINCLKWLSVLSVAILPTYTTARLFLGRSEETSFHESSSITWKIGLDSVTSVWDLVGMASWSPSPAHSSLLREMLQGTLPSSSHSSPLRDIVVSCFRVRGHLLFLDTQIK